MHRISFLSRRDKSTLAEKLRAAAGEFSKSKQVFVGSATVKDDNGEDFNEFFVMPKRKLRGQMQLEQATGRAEVKQRSRVDINDRLSERRPRSEEMIPDQEWSTVWPAARTFSASVVPLPVRMGTRPNVEKRAPFKKEGNLELVKIPNFLHLTPAAIQKHCETIRKFCTPFPLELLNDDQLAEKELPITVQYNTYVHQGTNIRDIRSRVVTMTVNVEALKFSEVALNKLIRLAGDRYDEKTKVLTIITDRCHTRQQNLDYSYYLLTVLFHESNKVESWEKLQERADHLKVEFDGSPVKEKLSDLLEKSGNLENKDEKIVEFGKMWKNYRNNEETVEATREYSRQIKELLGLSKIITKQPEVSQQS